MCFCFCSASIIIVKMIHISVSQEKTSRSSAPPTHGALSHDVSCSKSTGTVLKMCQCPQTPAESEAMRIKAVYPVTHRALFRDTALMTDSEDEMHFHFQRKQRRKSRRCQDGGEEPPIIRGLWVQEIDWLKSADGAATSSAVIIPPPPPFTDSQSCLYEGCSCADLLDSGHRGGSEDTPSSEDRDSDSDCSLEQDSECVCTQESESDSSCGAEDAQQVPDSFGAEARLSNLTFDLMHAPGCKSSSPAEPQSDSAGCVQSLLGMSDSTPSAVNTSQNAFGSDDTILGFLRGRVTLMPKPPVSPFFRELIKHTLSEWTTSGPRNDGLIFHHVRLLCLGSTLHLQFTPPPPSSLRWWVAPPPNPDQFVLRGFRLLNRSV